MFKLALWARKTCLGNEALQQVKNLKKTCAMVLTDLLALIVQEAREQFSRLFDPDVWRNMWTDMQRIPIHMFLCFPQLFHPPAKLCLLEAAQKSDVDSVQLVPEPYCGAAFMVARRVHNGPTQAGDFIVNADIGGGSGDFCTFSIQRTRSSAYKSEFKLHGEAVKVLTGSQYIDYEFLKAMRNQGRVEEMRAQLRTSIHVAESKLLTEFEDFKLYKADALCKTASADTTLKWPFEHQDHCYVLGIKIADIRKAYDKIINKNLEQIRNQLDNIPDDARHVTVEVPSELGRCKYFMIRLENEVSSRRNVTVRGFSEARLVIAKGACLRYTDRSIDRRPPNVRFGIGWDEPFDRAVHNDAVEDRELIVCTNAGQARGSKKRAVPYVQNRFKWFLGLDQRRATQGPQLTNIVQEHYVDVEDLAPLTQVVYCTEAPIPDHAAVLAHVDIETADAFKWRELVMDTARIIASGFPVVQGPDGRDCYLIYTQLVLRDDGSDLDFGWRIITEDEYDAGAFVDPAVVEKAEIIWGDFESERLVSAGTDPFPDPNAVGTA